MRAGPRPPTAARRRTVASPLGPLTLTAAGGVLAGLEWGPPADAGGGEAGDDGGGEAVLDRAAAALAAYFAGRPLPPDAAPVPAGTPYQQRVWQAMAAIPFGATLTYGALAARLGSGPRAVAMACARNPIPILIPCHRVVGAAGLGGYSGGAGPATKRWLLAHEQRHARLGRSGPAAGVQAAAPA